MNKEQAIEAWAQVQRLIEAGAYSERSAEHYETDTWPEDGVEETAFNLENYAARNWAMEFCYNHDDKTWSLVPIEQGEE